MKKKINDQYHFIGIGGIGMSALANILLQKGVKVTGSDVATSSITDQLQKQGAEIFIGHSPQNIQPESTIVYSTDIKDENPEVKEARLHNIPFLHRSELLHRLMQGYCPLLVTGTHGKTTTSSLLAHLLVEAGLHPAYAVGGVVRSLNANGGHGTGRYFVAEADESDGSFLNYTPFGAIITNVDNDHLAYWNDIDSLIEGFRKFAMSVTSPEHLFWCGDDEALRAMNLKGFSYGFEDGNHLQVENFRQAGWKIIFDVAFDKKEYTEIEIPLIGAHNVLNAAAVFGMGIKVGISERKIRKAFASFKGVNRRAEVKGETGSISILDDYAHHPTEIFATLHAIKNAIGHRRLIAAFQPHRYTRTRDCLHEFGPAFMPADLVVLTDIYAAREEPINGISTQVLLGKIQDSTPLDVRYVQRDKLTEFLAGFLQPNDVLVTLGAGDITKVGPEVLQLLKK